MGKLRVADCVLDELKTERISAVAKSGCAESWDRIDVKAGITSEARVQYGGTTDIRGARGRDTASGGETNVIFLAITSGRSGRAERLVSDGTLRASAHW